MTYERVWLLPAACDPGWPGMGTDGILFCFIDSDGYDLDCNLKRCAPDCRVVRGGSFAFALKPFLSE